MHKVARFVSVITHPLLVPLATVYIAYNYDWYINGSLNTEQIRIIYLVILFSSLLFPVLNLLLLKWYGMISSFSLPGRAERYAPYISTLFFFSLGYYMLRKGALPHSLYAILTGGILTLVFVTLINFTWKISAHAAGIFNLIGAVIALFRIHTFSDVALLSLLILLAGVVMSARLLLKAHTAPQVYGGALLGFITSYTCVYFNLFI